MYTWENGSGGGKKRDLGTLLLGACLPVALAIFTFAWFHRHDGQALAEIDALLARGDAEHEACRRFLGQWDEFSRSSRSGAQYDKHHASRASALEALSLLEKNPGWAPGYAATADYFDDHSAELERNAYQIDLLARRAHIEADCDALGFFRHAQMLLADTKLFSFTPAEELRTHRLVSNYLTREPEFRSFIEAALKATLLAELLEQTPGKEKEAMKARALADDFERRRKLVFEVTRGEPFFWPFLTLRSSSFERRQTQELYRAYYGIVREAGV